jgi:hypothetical protein
MDPHSFGVGIIDTEEFRNLLKEKLWTMSDDMAGVLIHHYRAHLLGEFSGLNGRELIQNVLLLMSRAGYVVQQNGEPWNESMWLEQAHRLDWMDQEARRKGTALSIPFLVFREYLIQQAKNMAPSKCSPEVARMLEKPFFR